MTPCRLRKKLRNSVRSAQTQINPKTTHAKRNKTVHGNKEISKTEIQYISDKLEATCSVTNQYTVINPDASTKVLRVSMRTPIKEKIKMERKIDEGGDRLPDLKLPRDKRGAKPPGDNRISFLLKKIARARKANAPPVQKSTYSHFSLPELSKFEFPLTQTFSTISDLSNVSMTSVDSGFEKNKTASLKIDFTPTEQDEDSSQKCLDFWSYLETRDDLKHLYVYSKEDLKLNDGELMTDEQKTATNKAYNEVLKKQKEEQVYPAIDSIKIYHKGAFKYHNFMRILTLLPINI